MAVTTVILTTAIEHWIWNGIALPYRATDLNPAEMDSEKVCLRCKNKQFSEAWEPAKLDELLGCGRGAVLLKGYRYYSPKFIHQFGGDRKNGANQQRRLAGVRQAVFGAIW